jgi:tripartite-type tricarboxylate transporter receptor subunit TctC
MDEPMKMFRAGIVSAALLLQTVTAGLAFPENPVRLIVGWPAGGPVDAVARLVQGELGRRLGVPVIIENRAGVSGMLATETVLNQPRDGQTLLLCTHYEAMNPVMYRSAKYKIEDVAGVSMLARYYLALATPASSPYQNLQDVITAAKQNPGKLTYGTTGPGSTQDMLMRQLTDLSGTTMQSVPFRGAAPALTEVVAGRLDLFLSPTGPAMPLTEGRQIRLLATTSTSRLAVTPDVSTFAELGYPLKLYGWIGICAGKGTPEPIIERLNRELAAILGGPEYRTRIEATGQIAEASSAAELQATLTGMSGEISELVTKYAIQTQ